MRRLAAVATLFGLGLLAAALSLGPARGATLAAVLTGTVGPGFTISLTQSGTAVTSLPEGTYEVDVTDSAAVHNFHLSGPGVDKATDIAGTGSVSWTVTLQPGTYTYQCDAHPTLMHGSFTVTPAATTTASTTTDTTTTATTTTAETTTTPDTTTATVTTDTTPTTTAAETTTTTVTTAAPAVRLTVVAARRTGVRVRLTSSRPGHALARLTRGTRAVATVRASVHAGHAMLTLQRRKPFPQGRYVVRVSVTAGGRTGRAAASVRID